MNPNTRQFLIDFFKPYNEELSNFIDIDLDCNK